MENLEIYLPEVKPRRLWTWVDILLIGLSIIAVILLGTWVFSSLSQPVPGEQPGITIGYIVALTSLEVFAILVSVYIFGLLRKKLHWTDVGFVPSTFRWLVWAAATALIFIPIIGLIALAIQVALGLPTENPQLEFLVPKDITWFGGLIMLILGGLLVPIAEEVLFRGVLYRWLRQFLRPWIAIPISSALFGLLHGDIAVAGATFVMGIVLAWFYERSHSLWPSIVIHAVNNGLKLALLYGLLVAGYHIPPLV